jgi:hypothetical protein
MVAARSDGLGQLVDPVGSASRRNVRPCPYVAAMEVVLLELSDAFKQTAAVEREKLLERFEYCRQRSERHTQLAAEAAQEAERYARAIREIGELLGIEDQLSINELHDELRGERLRDVAADVLWRHFREGDVVHYKQWLELVTAEGHRIGGKNPTATFLTQVARVETVERVGRRSGLYKLRAVA